MGGDGIISKENKPPGTVISASPNKIVSVALKVRSPGDESVLGASNRKKISGSSEDANTNISGSISSDTNTTINATTNTNASTNISISGTITPSTATTNSTKDLQPTIDSTIKIVRIVESIEEIDKLATILQSPTGHLECQEYKKRLLDLTKIREHRKQVAVRRLEYIIQSINVEHEATCRHVQLDHQNDVVNINNARLHLLKGKRVVGTVDRFVKRAKHKLDTTIPRHLSQASSRLVTEGSSSGSNEQICWWDIDINKFRK